MPDQRSVMKEFRFLDEKRVAKGLTPAEEARYAHLRDLIGPELGAGGLRPGFDVDAAAARLRDSLLPAGLRNRPPPTPAAAEPPAPEEPAAAEALESAFAEQPFAPLETAPQPEGFFDPASLSEAQPAYDAGAAEGEGQAWDPNAPALVEAPAEPGAAYDAGQGWDPNAPPYDATQAEWDPNAQPYDPTQAQWDPNAQPYEAAPPADAGAQPWPAPDANAAYDAEGPAYDPNAPPYDPGASPEAGGQGYPEPSPEAAGEVLPEAGAEGEPPSFVADDGSLAPAGWYAEPAQGEAAPPPSPGEGEPPALSDAGIDSMLPFDPAAAAAITPGEVPEGFGERVGEYDDTAGFASRYVDAAPADLPQEGPEFQAAQAVSADESEGWQPEAVLDEGFQLESGGSFDATAEAAAPEWAGGAAAPPWESEPAAAPEEPQDFAAPDAAVAAPEVEAEYVEPLPDGEEPAEAPAFESAVEGAALAEPEPVEPLEEASHAEPAPAADEFSVDVAEAPAEEGALPALDFSRPDFSAGLPSEEEAAFVEASGPAPEAAALEPSFDVAVEPEAGVPPIDLGGAAPGLELTQPPGAELSPDVSAAVVEVAEEDLPTIEGEEILEELPAEPAPAELEFAPAPAPAVPEPAIPEPEPTLPEPELAVPAPAPAAIPVAARPVPPPPPVAPPLPVAPAAAATPPAPAVPPPPIAAEAPAQEGVRVPGTHRVVVHTVEGQVKRGVLEDAALDAGSLGLLPQPGAAPELVPAEKVKAIFFMLGPGEKAPTPEGKKVRVTFRDGRQVAGFSPDYRDGGVGFFMIPGDTRTNTGRIWVYRSAVRQVSVT
jgi:hypothetical protein